MEKTGTRVIIWNLRRSVCSVATHMGLFHLFSIIVILEFLYKLFLDMNVLVTFGFSEAE